ncbi:MAG TPA: glycosyltransferase 87 family protein [Ktedonobacterales bacterium]
MRMTEPIGALSRVTARPTSSVEAQWMKRRWSVLALWGIIAVSALAHLAAVKTSTGAEYDIASYRMQAETVFRHINIYLYPPADNRYPYPPVWIWIIAALQWLSTALSVRFEAMAKLPAVLGDLAIVGVLYLYARERVGAGWRALIPPALFAFNPLAILISAGHGQFDALVVLFVLLAVHLRGPHADRHVVWSALALGMAIALKGYPVLVLPYLTLTVASWRKRLVVAALSFAPVLVSFVVYAAVFGYTERMVTSVLRYRSSPIFGWIAVSADSPWFKRVNNVQTAHAMHVALALLIVVIPLLLMRARPAAAISFVFCAFYATTLSMAPQYLLWAVPFLCVAAPVGMLVLTAIAFPASLVVYRALQQTGAIPGLGLFQQVGDFASALHVPQTFWAATIILVSVILADSLILKAARTHSIRHEVAVAVRGRLADLRAMWVGLRAEGRPRQVLARANGASWKDHV